MEDIWLEKFEEDDNINWQTSSRCADQNHWILCVSLLNELPSCCPICISLLHFCLQSAHCSLHKKTSKGFIWLCAYEKSSNFFRKLSVRSRDKHQVSKKYSSVLNNRPVTFITKSAWISFIETWFYTYHLSVLFSP